MIKDIFADARGTVVEEIRPSTDRYKDFFSSVYEYELFCIFCADMIDFTLMTYKIEDPTFDLSKVIDGAYYLWKFHVSQHIRLSNNLLTRVTDIMAAAEETDTPDGESEESGESKDGETPAMPDEVMVENFKLKLDNN